MDKRVKVLHTIGFLGFGGMEGGVIKLVNRLDSAHFIPHVLALRDFDRKAKNTLEKDIKFK